jgi:DNA-binding NarL/FixJ family response regulator
VARPLFKSAGWATNVSTPNSGGLVSAHPVLHEGLRLLLSNDHGILISHEAGSTDEAVTVMTQQAPDVVVVDPCDDITLNALTQLTEAVLTRVLVFTSITDPTVHRRL